ncbi:MAG: hypothetical protein AAFR38_05680 [Planctomycetota bacterium]
MHAATHAQFAALIATAVIAGPGTARVTVVDDLTDGSFDPRFAYDFFGDDDLALLDVATLTGFPADSPVVMQLDALTEDRSGLTAGGLSLSPDLVEITFAGVGDPIVEAVIRVTDAFGPGLFIIEADFTDETGFFTIGAGNTPETVLIGTRVTDLLGPIRAIRIIGFDSLVTEVSVTAVPGPGPVGAALLGLAALRRRRD